MIKLIKLELFKETKKKSFLISILLIIGCSFIVSYFVNKQELAVDKKTYIIENKLSENEFNDNYKLSNYDNYLYQYDKYIDLMQEKIKLESYNNQSKTKNIFEETFNIQVFLLLLISFIGSGIVNYEINKGTIKTMITSSYSKSQILLSKLICLIIISIIFNIVLLLSMTLFSSLMSGVSIFPLKEFIVNNGIVLEVNYYLYSLKTFFLYLIPIIFICFMSVFLSVLFSTSVASVIAVGIPLIANIISQILIGFNIKFIQYTFLPYIDFSIFNDKLLLISSNMELGVNINLKYGIIILFMFSIMFFILSNLIFNKKDLV